MQTIVSDVHSSCPSLYLYTYIHPVSSIQSVCLWPFDIFNSTNGGGTCGDLRCTVHDEWEVYRPTHPKHISCWQIAAYYYCWDLRKRNFATTTILLLFYRLTLMSVHSTDRIISRTCPGNICKLLDHYVGPVMKRIHYAVNQLHTINLSINQSITLFIFFYKKWCTMHIWYNVWKDNQVSDNVILLLIVSYS